MSDAIDDMVAYTNLTDAVIQMIMMSTDTKLKEVIQELHIIMFTELIL